MSLRSRALLTMSAASLSLSLGCHRPRTFGAIPPPPLYMDGAITKGYPNNVAFNDACISAAAAIETNASLTADGRRLARNRELARRIMAVRQTHAVYTGRVVQHKATFDTATEVLLAAGTAVSAINPGTAIGATNTALLAAKGSVDKNFYDDLSRTALLIDIYKNSKSSEAAIVAGFARSYDVYPLSQGCSDIDAFFYSASATNAVGEAGETVVPKPTEGAKPADDPKPADGPAKPVEAKTMGS